MKLDHKKYTVVAVLAALILLLMAGSVMAQPVITTFKPDTETAVVGQDATWTVTSPNAVSYAFYVFKRADGEAPEKRVHTQWYSANNSVTYRFLEQGDYYARVFAEDAGGKLTIVDSPEALDVAVTGDSYILTGLEFEPKQLPDVNAGEGMSCTVKPVGGEGPFQYAFYVFFLEEKEGAEWKRVHLQWYTAGPSTGYEFKYTPEEPGKYKVQAFIQDVSTKIVNDFSNEVTVSGTSQGLGIDSIEASEPSEGKITWTVTATGQGTLEYAFYVLKEEEGGDLKRVDLQWYSSNNTCTYRPLESGTYQVRVFVLEVDTGKTVNGYSGEVVFEDGEALAVQVGLWDSVEGKYIEEEPFGDVGEVKTWKATVSGGQEPCEYAFYVYEREDGVDKRVHMQWYSEIDEVTYMPKDADALYWVRVFVIDVAGILLVADSGHVQFSGTTVAPFGIEKVQFKKQETAEVMRHFDGVMESVTYDGYSLSDFRLPWVWEVVLPDNYEGMGDGKISYCYYLYKDDNRIATQWYEEGAGTFSYVPKEAGVYQVRAFAMDEHGHIANAYSDPQETKLYHFNYIFDQFEGLSEEYGEYTDELGNKNHGWIWDKGYFFEKHHAVQEDTRLLAYAKDVTGKTHDIGRFPAHDLLSPRGYGNQTSTRSDDRPFALNVGGNAARTYYRGEGGTLYFGTMKPGGHGPTGAGDVIEPSNGLGCVWEGETLEEGGFSLYRFAGLRPQVASGRNYYPKQEFWTYMIAPNQPYGEIKFKNIHSTDCEDDDTQEARFNFEFMHHSTGYGSSVVGGDPYDQRIGISISENGTVRVLDSKAGLGKFNDARDNFYMPVLKDGAGNPINATNQLYGGFDNGEWNTLRIQCLVNGKVQFLLNDKLVYETPLGYYHVTNAERGTITLEVVQAAKTCHERDVFKDEDEEQPIDSSTVGNAWVELKDYSFGIMRIDHRDDYPGNWD